MKFKNHFNAVPDTGEVNSQPSMTVPDQTMSVKEILEKHARGGVIGLGGKQEVYNGEEEIPDLKRMDLSEIAELKEANLREIQKFQEQRIKNAKTKKEKEENEKIKAEAKKMLKEALEKKKQQRTSGSE